MNRPEYVDGTIRKELCVDLQNFKIGLWLVYIIVLCYTFQVFQIYDTHFYVLDVHASKVDKYEILENTETIDYLQYTKYTFNDVDTYFVYYYIETKILWMWKCSEEEFNTLCIMTEELGGRVKAYESPNRVMVGITFVLICAFPRKNKVYYDRKIEEE